jgi:hypothetical protein
VHFFVSDHGNAKVKALCDQFIDALIANGISVYAEHYLTHQPGYQVRAAALNSPADFFFQIHSKTAGPGHVRLYIAGQPKRMTTDEAVATVWSWWRLQCGGLSRDEVELISREKIAWLLHEFGNIGEKQLDFAAIQDDARVAIERSEPLGPILDRLSECETLLRDAKSRITTTKVMRSEWPRVHGVQLARCLPTPHASGLSTPLREMLVSVVDQALNKIHAIRAVINRVQVRAPGGTADGEEIPIDSGEPNAWKDLIESLDDDNVGSMRIASYGDSEQSEFQDSSTFLLDDYE